MFADKFEKAEMQVNMKRSTFRHGVQESGKKDIILQRVRKRVMHIIIFILVIITYKNSYRS